MIGNRRFCCSHPPLLATNGRIPTLPSWALSYLPENKLYHEKGCDQLNFNMALRRTLLPSLALVSPWSTIYQPAVRSKTVLSTSQQLNFASLFKLPIAIPIHFTLRIPSIFSGLWDSILRAVPKKKTSHRKKRQRFMAGKALQDVTNLNKCSACGNVKRAHLLCPYCVTGKL